jgi:HTH-type transcriptional repressor of NAD biosynthesis genes
MKKGFVFGKFMPLHKGHLALIEFALKHCDHIYVVFCFTGNEPIDHLIRKQWLYQALENYPRAQLVSFGYDEDTLPNSSVSSREVSQKWAVAFKALLPDVSIVFTSEPYGEYVSGFMGIQHMIFDQARKIVPVSATQIREKPFRFWNFIPEYIRYWFVKKVCLVGTESTGKSTLAKNMAAHFDTDYVPEMAREVIETTIECTYEDLYKIAELHARTILKKMLTANKLLFVDTDLTITRSYAAFLFNKDLIVEPWIEEANVFDLYLYLESDSEFVQDGTRLISSERNRLNDYHKSYFNKSGISTIPVSGSWENRFKTGCEIVYTTFNSLM